MTELIVLGTIPGTTLQFGFMAWLYTMIGVGSLVLLTLIHRNRLHLLRSVLPFIFAFVVAQTTIRPRRLA